MLTRLLNSILEYVFPERNDHKVVRELEVDDLLSHLQPTRHPSFTSLLPFSEPMVKAVVHEAKFHGNEKAWRLLGGVLAEYLKQVPGETTVLPIPLSDKRLKSRGYNQVAMVARRAMTQTPHLHLREDILIRTRDTTPQTKLRRAERLKNVVDAFSVSDLSSLTGMHIIILDDVATTGATLEAAAISLKSPSVTLLALAH